MDKVTLTREQLRELKRYIHSRGFREPLIVMEILDHFACLVEEKMQVNPKLTLDEAMKQAHSSFGIMGFKALADTAAAERNKRYNKAFKANMRDVFANPHTWLLTILASIPFYMLCLWLQVQDWGFLLKGADVMFIIVIMVYAGSMLLAMPKRNKNYYTGYGNLADNGYSWLVYILVISVPHYRLGAPDWIFATVDTIVCAFIILYSIAHAKTVKSITNELINTEKQHADL